MAFLYINSKGEKRYHHSYSSGNTYEQSPYKYYLQKVLGWRPKDNKAAFHFGRALEQSIQFHHDNNGIGAVEDFIQRWSAAKDLSLVYTKVESSWESLMKAGTEMIRLYQIRQPSFPIPLGAGVVFQREYSKEVFPGDENYGGIEFLGKTDIIAYVDPNHPMLPKGVHTDSSPVPIIIDIKTGKDNFPERPGTAAFDKQIRVYSWLTGIRIGGFLWFTKTGHRLQRGSSVTVLDQVGTYVPGSEAVIAQVKGEHSYIVANDYFLGEMDKAQGLKEDGSVEQTKAAKKRRDVWLKEHATLVENKSLTRQRLQLNIGVVSPQSAADAGQVVSRQIIQIVNSWKTKSWPNTFGVRYPSNDMKDPYFRAFVLNEKEFKDQNFTQTDSEEIDDLFDEECEQVESN